ncbi:hypothetical protein Tco_1080151 [Tanacetum coccineum]|uniref:Tf2-1-like SH3-like domain-containing protein n=1 Tax=Tanacetum coccineum TaxID=301880 RepID=A0ABQ5HTW8_9ASTR
MSFGSEGGPKVGAVAYKLELPQELSRVHNTFHVSNLKKCYADEPLAVPLDGLHIDDKLYFVEELIEIMDLESGPKEAEQAPPPPDFVPEPVYLDFMPVEDDVLPAEEQPLPDAVSPTADSPGYITESDLEEDPEEDDDEDHEEDLADYLTNRDDDDEEEEESSRDDANDEEEDRDEYVGIAEEEVAPSSADSIPPPACRTTTRMSIQDQTPIPFPYRAEVNKLLTISTPPPSPVTLYSSPLPRIPSPPLPISSPLPMSTPPLPASPTYPLGYRAAMIWLRAESPSTSHLLPPPIVLPQTRASMAMMRAAAPSTYILASRSETPPSGTPPLLHIPLPTSSPPLLLPSTDCREDVLEVRLPPRKRVDTATNVAELGQRMTNFVTTVRQDIDEIYGRLDDAQDDRSLMSGQFNLLRRDKRAHASTTRLMESEARASREAWTEIGDLAGSRTVDDLDTSFIEALTLSEDICKLSLAAIQSQQDHLIGNPAHLDVPE